MSIKPTPFCVDEKMYYNSKELQEYDPIFYFGCKTKPRHILNKKNIPTHEYLFANLKDGKWKISTEECKKAQLLISQSWIEANMQSMLPRTDAICESADRRIGEHETKYGKLENVSIKLATFHVIDTKYTSEAEGDIRELVNTFQKKLNVEGFNELIVLNAKELAFVKKQYSYLGNNYAGATAELQKQIVELKNKIKDLENEITIIKLTNDLELQKERNENQSLKSQNKSLEEKLETCKIIANLKEEVQRLQQK